MKIAIVTQARVGSTRLPEKILREIGNKTLLEIHLHNAQKSKSATHFFVATTDEPNAHVIEKIAQGCEWSCYRGSTSDVLARFFYAVESLKPDYIVRITSDCPFVQPRVIDDLIDYCSKNELDYAATSENFPDGVDVEILTLNMLELAFQHAQLASEREHVTPWIRKNAQKQGLLEPEIDSFKDVRLTVDEINDFFCIERLYEEYGYEEHWKVYSEYVFKHPEFFENQKIQRNEGYTKSLINDSKLKNG